MRLGPFRTNLPHGQVSSRGWSSGRSDGRSVGGSVGWSVGRSVGRSVGGSVGRSVRPLPYRNPNYGRYELDILSVVSIWPEGVQNEI